MNPFRNLTLALATMATLAATLAVASPAEAKRKPATPTQEYTFTIYADESGIGHVFLSLSRGHHEMFRGFYSQNYVLAPLGAGGGELKDDRTHDWDVRKRFKITEHGFKKAMNELKKWHRKTPNWTLSRTCSDYVESVGKAAGVTLHLKRYFTGRNRPQLLAHYLRNHGGEDNPKKNGAIARGGKPGPKDTGKSKQGDYGVFLAGNDVLVGKLAEINAKPAGSLTGWGNDMTKTVGQTTKVKRVLGPFPTLEAATAAYRKNIIRDKDSPRSRPLGLGWSAKFKFDGKEHSIDNAPSASS